MDRERLQLKDCYWFQFKNSDIIEVLSEYAERKNLNLICFTVGEKAAWGLKTKLVLSAIPKEKDIPGKLSSKKNSDYLKDFLSIEWNRIYVVKTMRSKIYTDLLGFYEKLVERYGQ